jgi:hypothetical protein
MLTAPMTKDKQNIGMIFRYLATKDKRNDKIEIENYYAVKITQDQIMFVVY